MVDLAVTETINSVSQPAGVYMVHSNGKVAAEGNTVPIYIGGASLIDVLIYVGTMTGVADITYHIDVIESVSGKTITSYDGAALSTGAEADYISTTALVNGDYIKIRWSGTLDGTKYFSGVYCRVVVK